MRKLLGYVAGLALICSFCMGTAQASEQGTKDDAVAMVQKVVAAISADGAEKVYAEINSQENPEYKDRGIYPIVYTFDGKCLVHGANAKLVGRDLSASMDTDGKMYGEERGEKAKTMDSFWVDYKYKNPVTLKIAPKTLYCEKVAETLVCAGVYVH